MSMSPEDRQCLYAATETAADRISEVIRVEIFLLSK
jgi:hypothetical protein